MPDSADWIFSLCLSSALAGGWKLYLELAADCGRITGDPEVNPKVRVADDPGVDWLVADVDLLLSTA